MSSIRTLKITHHFSIDRPGRSVVALFSVLPVAIFVNVAGLWASLAALGVLVAMGAVTFTLETPTAPQEARQEPQQQEAQQEPATA